MMKLPAFDRQMHIFDSDNIEEVFYDTSTKTMMVRFTNATRYLYQHVSLAQFSTIVGSESVGKTFNKMKPALLDFKRIE